MRDGFVGCHYALVEQAGSRGSPQSLHVLDKTSQLGQLLRDLRLGDASAFTPPGLDEAALDQILNRPSRSAILRLCSFAASSKDPGIRGQPAAVEPDLHRLPRDGSQPRQNPRSLIHQVVNSVASV